MKNCWKLKLSRKTIFVLLFFQVLIQNTSAQENPYMFPIRPDQRNYLSGTMGELRGSHFHGGIDIKTGGATGVKVFAASDGYVSRIKVNGGGYGNALYIAHPQLGTTTVYGHLQKYNEEMADYVLKAQYKKQSFAVDLFPDKDVFIVKKGDFVAFSGNSGGSGGPHLHFEIRNQYQTPLNPLDFRFDEIKDNISPIVQTIGLKTMNKDSRINHQFGFFEFTPSKLKNEYTISQTVEVYGEIGILLMGYDRLNDASNRNGIPHIQMLMDERPIIDITIDKIPFSKTRQILCFTDYGISAKENKKFQKLYIDDGNELGIFNENTNRGILTIKDTLVHDLQIRLKDAYGNTSFVNLKIKGTKPEVTAIKNSKGFKPFRNTVFDNTLMFMGKKAEQNGFFAHVFSNRMSYELSPNYYVNDYSVYLWDLRTGMPDSIEMCGEKIYPGLEMVIPSDSDFRYYKSEFDLRFYTKTLFDTLYLKTDYMDE